MPVVYSSLSAARVILFSCSFLCNKRKRIAVEKVHQYRKFGFLFDHCANAAFTYPLTQCALHTVIGRKMDFTAVSKDSHKFVWLFADNAYWTRVHNHVILSILLVNLTVEIFNNFGTRFNIDLFKTILEAADRIQNKAHVVVGLPNTHMLVTRPLWAIVWATSCTEKPNVQLMLSN